MNGVGEADITNNSFFGMAGFTGNITGLTTAVLEAGSVGGVQLGLDTQGLNTALANVTIERKPGLRGMDDECRVWDRDRCGHRHSGRAVGVDTEVTLNDTTVGATSTLGYGTIDVASGGGPRIFSNLTRTRRPPRQSW